MKKSSFVVLVMGTVSGLLFSLGMCMALLPQWDTFREGVVFGGIGLLLGLVTVLVWRKMEHKAPIRISGKTLAAAALGIFGSLLLGVGMCFCLVWGKMVVGILIGIVGIILLLCLIPLVKGFKE